MSASSLGRRQGDDGSRAGLWGSGNSPRQVAGTLRSQMPQRSSSSWAKAAHMACWLSAFLNAVMSNTNSQSPPRRPGLGGAPRVPAAGHAEGNLGQLLSCSADLSSNPLGPTPLEAEGGAARISVSVLRADQLHAETEHTECTLCLPWAQPGSLAEVEGGREWGWGQRTVGHSFCPPS